jgi:hypothetical protein
VVPERTPSRLIGTVIGCGPHAELAVHNGVFRCGSRLARPGWEWQVCWLAQSFPRFSRVSPVAVLDAFVSACLSAIGVRLTALQESPGQVRDQVGLLVETEVAGVQDVHLGVWHIPVVGLGLLHLE